MAQMTPKEKYLGLYQGYIGDDLPTMSFGGGADGEAPATAYGGPMELTTGEWGGNFMNPGPPREKWKDLWGVTYVANSETGFGGLPQPGNFLIKDITKWDEVVKKPDKDVAGYDWEGKVAESLKDVDRTQTAVMASIGIMPFEQLMAFMGFTEGLCALVEEPEACKELLSFMCDYIVPIVEKTVEYWNPDIVGIGDDSASKYAPFFSMETYKEIFSPVYARLFKPAVDRGIPIDFHNCGKCEAQIDEMVRLGVRFWNPAQTENDLLGIKARHKNLAICGGWDFVPGPGGEVTEEEIRASVRESIDKYAKGGQFMFGGGYLGRADDQERTMVINGWAMDEAKKYGKDYYKRNPDMRTL